MKEGIAAARAVAELRGGHVTHLLDADGLSLVAKLPQRCGWCGLEIRSWGTLMRANEKWISPGSLHHMCPDDVRCDSELEPETETSP